MSINLTDEIEVKTKKGKLGAAKQIFLEGDTQTVEKEIQDINSRHNTLNTKHESLSRTVQGIAVTGGASTATNVTYNNDSSELNAENAQDAIDELNSSKFDKTSILQELGTAIDKVMSQGAIKSELDKKIDKTSITKELGTAEDKVMSQKATSTELNKKANTADVDTKLIEEKNRVDGELGKKFDKESVAQESGEDEDKVMSQKATTTAIADETTRAKAEEEAIIFDVSAHNNGAVFESLSALLNSSDLSTLIPTSVRHGGMTIRFVQSSDNKYIQYRLMSTSFSTNEADWQGDAIMGTDRIADGAVTFNKLYPDLQSLITNLSKNYVFAGIATPTTNPGTPDGPVFYITTEVGAYSNFGGIELESGEAAILLWNNGAWTKKTTGLGTQDKLSELDDKTGIIIQSEEFIKAITDANGKFLYGVKSNGDFDWANGLPEHLKNILDNKVNKDELSSLLEYIENPEYAMIVIDGNCRIVLSIRNDDIKDADESIKNINNELKDAVLPCSSVINEGLNYSYILNHDNIIPFLSYYDVKIARTGIYPWFNINYYENTIHSLQSNGIEPLADFALPSERDADESVLEYMENKVKPYIQSFCIKYPSVKYFETVNELDLLYNNSKYRFTIDDVFTVYKMYYTYIKQYAGNDALVAIGGLSSTALTSNFIDSLCNIEQEDKHIWDYFDVFNIHYYPSIPEQIPQLTQILLNTFYKHFSAKNKTNILTKRVWVTESGYSTYSITNREQAILLLRNVLLLYCVGVDMVSPYTLSLVSSNMPTSPKEEFFNLAYINSNVYLSLYKNYNTLTEPLSKGEGLLRATISKANKYDLTDEDKRIGNNYYLLNIKDSFVYDNLLQYGIAIAANKCTISKVTIASSVDIREGCIYGVTNESSNIWDGSVVDGKAIISADKFANVKNTDIIKIYVANALSVDEFSFEAKPAADVMEIFKNLCDRGSTRPRYCVIKGIYIAYWKNSSGIDSYALWSLSNYSVNLVLNSDEYTTLDCFGNKIDNKQTIIIGDSPIYLIGTKINNLNIE